MAIFSQNLDDRGVSRRGIRLGQQEEFLFRRDGSSRVRLGTLVWFGWLAVVGQLGAVLFVYYGLGYEVPLVSTTSVIGALAILNIALTIISPANKRMTEREAGFLLAFDLLQLAVLLYLTGGMLNPFVLLILVPVIVSATILGPISTTALGALAFLIGTFLTVNHLPLPWDQDGFNLPPLYVAGLWTALMLGMAFIGIYAWRVASEARHLSEALAAANSALAREQRMSELGGLVAAAAHELGTPLGTITLVAGELAQEFSSDSPYKDDIQLLYEQAARCRDILGKLAQPDAVADTGPYNVLPFHLLVETAVTPHYGLGTVIEVSAAGDGPCPVVFRSPEILHGIGNFVENAVGFAESKVDVAVSWDKDQIVTTVRDDGPGFPVEILSRLGEPYVSERAGNDGLGLGVFIAKTLLERTGAHVHFANRMESGEKKGAFIEIAWPRDVLEVPEVPEVVEVPEVIENESHLRVD